MYFPQRRVPVVGGAGVSENYVSGDSVTWLSHTRSGNATMYDSAGRLRYAANNQALYSEDYSNVYWTKALVSLGSAAGNPPVGYGTTATKLIATNSSGAHQLEVSSSLPSFGTNKTFIVSAVVKANGYGYGVIGYSLTSGSYLVRCSFNLTTGALSGTFTGTGGFVPPIYGSVDLGGGWWRIYCGGPQTTSLTYANIVGVRNASGDFSSTAWTGDNTNGIDVSAVQFEVVTGQTTPEAYRITTSAASNAPRLDHNPATLERRGLLVEAAATQRFFSTEVFNSTWDKGRVTVADNTADTTAPDGTQTAAKFTETAVTGTHRCGLIDISGTNHYSNYTTSGYYKYATSGATYACIYGSNISGANQAFAWFNLQTGVKGTSSVVGLGSVISYDMEPVGNGWYRCWISWATGGGGAVTVISSYLAMAATDGVYSYAGDTGRSIYVWGGQLEEGTSRSSYISNFATSGTISRPADAISAARYSSNSVSEYYRTYSTRGQAKKTLDPFSGVSSETGVWIERFTKP